MVNQFGLDAAKNRAVRSGIYIRITKLPWNTEQLTFVSRMRQPLCRHAIASGFVSRLIRSPLCNSFAVWKFREKSAKSRSGRIVVFERAAIVMYVLSIELLSL
jgi:hypothetical protein